MDSMKVSFLNRIRYIFSLNSAGNNSDYPPRLVFMHIPKTGGTSLHDALVRNFMLEDVCPERLNNLQSYDPLDLLRFSFFSGHYDFDGIDFIPGEKRVISLFRNPRDRILSLYYFWRSFRSDVIEENDLEGPRLAKKLSLIDFLRCEHGFVRSHIDNAQTRALIGRAFAGSGGGCQYPRDEVVDRAKSMVDGLYVFGVMDYYEHSFRVIFSELGFPVPAKIPHARNSQKLDDPLLEPVQREVITSEIDEELDRLTEMDQVLYDYSVHEFERKFVLK